MNSTSEKPREESPFWRFSLRFYSRPGVAAACLALQDEAGADVNLMLFLLFLAEHKRQVIADDIPRLDSTVRAWRDCVVKPLREVRREGCELTSLGITAPFRDRIAEANLAAYGDHLGGFPAPALATILAAFGEYGRHHPAGTA